jgi:hypothetical protein
MGTTPGRRPVHRRLGGRLRLALEPLELRLALSATASLLAMTSADLPSGGSLAIVSTSPAGSSVVPSSPSTLQVTFDRPLDRFCLSNTDFELLSVGADGSTSLVLGRDGESELIESLDPSGDQIDLGLSRPLTPGRYQVQLNPESQLRGLDGSTLPGSALGPVVVDDFKVSVSSPTEGLSSATDLQVLGPTEIAVPGQLDLADKSRAGPAPGSTRRSRSSTPRANGSRPRTRGSLAIRATPSCSRASTRERITSASPPRKTCPTPRASTTRPPR